ncbi:unnamed protein product [Lathyrus sativus]|nr:unnamed protein product [Lathyrus sativus]
MKLRLRSFESKETLKIEVPDPCSLQQLKHTISTILPSPSSSSSSSSLHLSLNRKDEIDASSPTDSLHSLGIAASDLIFYTFNPNAFSSETLPHKPAAEKPPTLAEKPAVVKTLEMVDVSDETVALVEKNNPEPDFVKKILKEALGDGGSDFKLLVFAVHAVILESGFVRVDRDSGKAIDDVSSSSMISLRYTLPEIVSKGLSHAVGLKIQTLGNFVNVYGSLCDDVGSRVHRVYLDKFRFAKPLELMLANSEPNANANASVSVSVSGNDNDGGDDEVFELWKIVKDKLALPLLIDLCDKAGLDLPPCFMRLPMELKLLIFEFLSGDDLAKVCCTCSELSYLASNDELWRKKFEEEFGHRMNGMKFFKNLFAHYRASKKKSEKPPLPFRNPRFLGYFQRRRGPVPFGMPPIWGGEYDLQPNFGVNLPPAYPPRRTFFPHCHLGEF